MHCSVGFSVTLRLLVINISPSSPAINTAAYYQRCVTTCGGTWAVVHQRPCWQHLACCTANSRQWSQIIGSELWFLPTPPAFDAPLGGFSSEYWYAVWHGKTRMVWLPNGEEILMISLFVLTEFTNVIHTQTPHDDIGRRACITSHGKNCIA